MSRLQFWRPQVNQPKQKLIATWRLKINLENLSLTALVAIESALIKHVQGQKDAASGKGTVMCAVTEETPVTYRRVAVFAKALAIKCARLRG